MQKILSPIFLLVSLQLSAQKPATLRLFQSIRSGNTTALEKELSTGVDPNDSLDGYSALMAATLTGSVEQMSLLIHMVRMSTTRIPRRLRPCGLQSPMGTRPSFSLTMARTSTTPSRDIRF